MGSLLVAGALGLAAGLAGAAFMLARARRGALPLDLPDGRRLHDTPTPRGGGVGLPLAGVAALPVVLLSGGLDRRLALAVLAWGLPNAVLGYVDDFRPMRSRVKLAIQLALALVAVSLGLRLDTLDVPPFAPVELGALAWPISALWLVWLANLYNFMDGMDALAAGSGALFLAGLGFWAHTAGLPAHAALAACVGCALLGFLRYNYPPAEIFMGDAGSLFVGAVLGGLALSLARADTAAVPVAASTLLMGTFVWDATYTIARRALRGDPMLPHRTHLYQRLALAGWSHGRVRALYLGLALAALAAALALPGARPAAAALLLAAALAGGVGLVLLTRAVERRP
jgi:UDP-GlcNAc:undecaprenyl-phosphate GlcNAc-1-phosphate transferase